MRLDSYMTMWYIILMNDLTRELKMKYVLQKKTPAFDWHKLRTLHSLEDATITFESLDLEVTRTFENYESGQAPVIMSGSYTDQGDLVEYRILETVEED